MWDGIDMKTESKPGNRDRSRDLGSNACTVHGLDECAGKLVEGRFIHVDRISKEESERLLVEEAARRDAELDANPSRVRLAENVFRDARARFNEEREALHAALADGIAQDDAGDTVDADEVLAHLRARAS